jgi:hypothetical protein
MSCHWLTHMPAVSQAPGQQQVCIPAALHIALRVALIVAPLEHKQSAVQSRSLYGRHPIAVSDNPHGRSRFVSILITIALPTVLDDVIKRQHLPIGRVRPSPFVVSVEQVPSKDLDGICYVREEISLRHAIESHACWLQPPAIVGSNGHLFEC